MTQDQAESARTKALQDRWIEARIEEARTGFDSGDRSKLLDVVFLCANYQAVIPDWAVDALLELREQLTRGKLRDWNDAFAWQHSSVSGRAAEFRRKQMAPTILAALMRHRISWIGSSLNPKLKSGEEAPDIDPAKALQADSGGNFVAIEGLQAIADECGVSRRDVEAVLKEYGDDVRAIPKGGGGSVHGVMHAQMPPLVARRRGRPLLRDE
jgi:hypothetical protein